MRAVFCIAWCGVAVLLDLERAAARHEAARRAVDREAAVSRIDTAAGDVLAATILCRHGQRTPAKKANLHASPEHTAFWASKASRPAMAEVDQTALPVPGVAPEAEGPFWGQLTAEGYRQVAAQGAKAAARYGQLVATGDQLLVLASPSGTQAGEGLPAHSVAVDRTVESARAFVRGFFQCETCDAAQLAALRLRPIDVSLPEAMFDPSHVDGHEQAYADFEASPAGQAWLQAHGDDQRRIDQALDALHLVGQPELRTFPPNADGVKHDWYALEDLLRSYYWADPQQLTKCGLSEADLQLCEDVTQEAWMGLHAQGFTARSGQPLLDKVRQELKAGRPQPVHVYNLHDSTLVQLMAALQFPQPWPWPEFAACMALELREDGEHIRYQDREVEVGGAAGAAPGIHVEVSVSVHA